MADLSKGWMMLHGLQTSVMVMLLAVSGAGWTAESTPTGDFVDNGNGTVLHKKTGLVWMRCALGQVWDGTNCQGEEKAYTYDEALKLPTRYAGYNDWRLPNMHELRSIIELENYLPSINHDIFPNTPNNLFLSSSPSLGGTHYGSPWFVGFGDGISTDIPVANFAVRLVRAGQWLAMGSRQADFIVTADGTVTDKVTGLMWSRCALGQIWTGSTCHGKATRYKWNTAKAQTSTRAGYKDWRLPTANELSTLIDYSKSTQAINTRIFPNTYMYGYWSSSPFVCLSYGAWRVIFRHGGRVTIGFHFTPHAVLLVRSGSADATPNNSILGSPYGAQLGQSVSSKTITVRGITTATPISIINGQYALNGGAFTDQPGTVKKGNRVQVQVTAASTYNTQVNATLTIGEVNYIFTVTTSIGLWCF